VLADLYPGMKRIWRKISLRTKITGLISFLIVSGVFTLTLLSIQLEKRYFKQDLENQADLLLETTSLSLRDPLYRLQLDELLDLARALSDNSDVIFFIAYDAHGKILVNSSQPEFQFSQEVDPLGKELINLPPGGVYKEWRDDQYVSGRPVVLGNQVIGAIAASLSTRALEEKISEMTLESILLAFVTGLAGALLGFWLANQITIPLSELAHGADQMSKGNLSIRVNPRSNDEVGQLAKVFNLMAASIQEREMALRDLAVGLEKTVEERTAVLREQTVVLEQMAITDPLTRIFNRRHFFTLAENEMEKATRYKRPLAIILIDADHFKRINDTYGHPFGDQILINLATMIQGNIRTMDILARYGGEEFVLLMPETGIAAALSTAERLRKIIAETPQAHNGKNVKLSISLGVACCDENAEPDITVLVARADQALYESKRRGRNMATAWETPKNLYP
jgi:diguanylate cyclase (GGDEF)-like protein